MSDTSINNRDSAHPNAIPGRLKSIVISDRMTVSYAGLSSQALDAVRSLRHKRISSTDDAIEFLEREARSYAGELDFILCSHENSEIPRLVKITADAACEGADFYWIGNSESASALSRFETSYNEPQDAPDWQSSEERRFANRFHEYMRQSRDPNVGGAVISCLCSPFGHCYQDHVGTHAWGTITIPDPTPVEVRAAEHRTGAVSYSYLVYCPAQRGVALVGFYLEQPGIGFLYLPLERDEPIRIAAADQDQFRRVVSAAAEERGAV